MPYAAALGITVDETAPELLRGRLRCTARGLLHGRAIMSLANTVGAGGQCRNPWPGPGARSPT